MVPSQTKSLDLTLSASTCPFTKFRTQVLPENCWQVNKVNRETHFYLSHYENVLLKGVIVNVISAQIQARVMFKAPLPPLYWVRV